MKTALWIIILLVAGQAQAEIKSFEFPIKVESSYVDISQKATALEDLKKRCLEASNSQTDEYYLGLTIPSINVKMSFEIAGIEFSTDFSCQKVTENERSWGQEKYVSYSSDILLKVKFDQNLLNSILAREDVTPFPLNFVLVSQRYDYYLNYGYYHAQNVALGECLRFHASPLYRAGFDSPMYFFCEPGQVSMDTPSRPSAVSMGSALVYVRGKPEEVGEEVKTVVPSHAFYEEYRYRLDHLLEVEKYLNAKRKEFGDLLAYAGCANTVRDIADDGTMSFTSQCRVILHSAR